MTQRKPTPSILDDVMSAAPAGVSRETGALRMVTVPLTRLEDNPYQTRVANDQDHVLGLAQSMVALAPTLPATRGLQQVPLGRIVHWGDGAAIDPADYDNPATLRQYLADSEYIVQLAFGHSRRLAFVALANGPAAVFPSLAGAEQVAFGGAEFDPADYANMPVILQPLYNADMWRHAVTENAQRKDISAIEEAAALQRAVIEFGMTVETAGRTFGWARSTAANKLRLLELPEEVQQAVMDGTITERHARELCRLIGDVPRINGEFEHVLRKGWTVNQLKSAVDWEISQIKEEQAKADELARAQSILDAGWTPPGSDVPLPADRLDGTIESWKCDVLDARYTHGCSRDCHCLRLIWHRYVSENHVVLSGQTPHVVLACIDSMRRRAIVAADNMAAQAAETDDASVVEPDQQGTEPVRQRAVAAAHAEYERKEVERLALREVRIAEAMQAWHDGIARLDKLTLWGSLTWWRLILKEQTGWYLEKKLREATSERHATDLLLEALLEKCVEYDNDASAMILSMQSVKAMLARLAPSKRAKSSEPEDSLDDVIARLAEPVAVPVSQETPAAITTPAQQVATGYEPVWKLEQAVSAAHDAFYRDDNELRSSVGDMRAAARIGAGGFWAQVIKQLGDRAYRKNDLVQAINNVASRLETQPPVSQETPATPATELPAELTAHGWQLHQMRGKWYAAVPVPGEEEPIRTQNRSEIAGVIADARYMDRELRIGVTA